MNASPDRPQLVAANLLLLLTVGVGFCFWTIRYTDWFPVIGGFLGLGGAFAWIAFVSGIIKDQRKEAFQDWLDRRVLQSRAFALGLALLLALFVAAVAARSGGLVIDAQGDDTARIVSITSRAAAGAASPKTFGVAPRGEQTALLWTGFLAQREYGLKADGLPEITVVIQPFKRTLITLPNDALAVPVVLVRPDPAVSGIANGGNFALEVQINQQRVGRLDHYLGATIWIGAERDVAIPPQTVARWRTEAIDDKARDAVLGRWTNPEAVALTSHPALGDRLRVAVVNADTRDVLGAACKVVTLPANTLDFPQELVIHEHELCK